MRRMISTKDMDFVQDLAEVVEVDNGLVINTESIIAASLPTADPLVAGALWNDNGVLKVSSGS